MLHLQVERMKQNNCIAVDRAVFTFFWFFWNPHFCQNSNVPKKSCIWCSARTCTFDLIDICSTDCTVYFSRLTDNIYYSYRFSCRSLLTDKKAFLESNNQIRTVLDFSKNLKAGKFDPCPWLHFHWFLHKKYQDIRGNFKHCYVR